MGDVRVLVNPVAGGARLARRVRAWWTGRRLPTDDWIETRDADHVTAEAGRAAADGIGCLVVVGGDGTIHRVLEPLSGTATALGIVPAGTGNDLAAELGFPMRPEDALDRCIRSERRRIDLGEVQGRPFAGTGGIGFDGEVARRVRDGAIRRLGKAAYALAALAALRTYRPPRISVRHDAGSLDERALFAVAANSSRFGGGMRIAPGARLDDGRLDLVVVRKVTTWELLRALPRVYAGKHVDDPHVVTARTSRATFEADVPVTVWGDGEPIVDVREGPIEFRVRPGALSIAG